MSETYLEMMSAPPLSVKSSGAARTSLDGRTVINAIVIGLLIFVPSAVRFLLSTSSFTAGLMGVCIVILGMAALGVIPIRADVRMFDRFTIMALMLGAILAHLVIPKFGFDAHVLRSLGSLIALALALATGIVVEQALLTEDSRIAGALRLVRIAFVVIAVIAIIGIQPPSREIFGRPIFPFSEPSHFALTFAPFLIDACVRGTPLRRALWVGTSFALAFFLQSLSLVVATTLAAVICFPAIQAAIVGIAATVAANYVDLDYYSERLDVSESSQNLSSLIYRQGWEAAWECLKFSRGWGVGFQQLGIAPVYIPTSDRIYALLGQDLSTADGSFVAAKIISEFGVFGIALVAVFLWIVLRHIWLLRKRAVWGGQMTGVAIFVSSVIVAYSVEMLVRGVGYFSGTTVLLFAALIAARKIYPAGGRRDR